MDIVIIAEFCGDMSGEENNRFIYIANIFNKRGWAVELITSGFDHSNKAQRQEIGKYPFKITLIHEPGYSKNICLRRLWSHYVWGVKVKRYLSMRNNPDVAYTAIPSLTAGKLVSLYCKRRRIPFIIDVQDLWPDAFRLSFSIPIISAILYFPFKCLANNIYRSANRVITVSDTYAEYLKSIGIIHVQVIYIGIDLKRFDEFKNKYVEYKNKHGEKWIGYCGTLGASYDLISVFNAIKRLQNKYKLLKFIIMGDGPSRRTFERYAKRIGINVQFTGVITYPRMCSLISRCDMAINPIKKKSSGSIINKHGDYAAASIPVVNTQDSQEYRKLIEKYDMGINCTCEDAQSISNAIEEILNNGERYLKLCHGARRCAEEQFDRNKTYRKIIEIIEEFD